MDASGGSTMAGMDHAAMGHDMPTGGAAAGGMAGMDMGSGASMPTPDKTPGGSMASMPGMGAPAGDAMAGMAMGGMGGMNMRDGSKAPQAKIYRKSVVQEQRGSVRVDLGGRRASKKKIKR